jgi:hypothetical protein
MSDADRQRRAGENEALFRQVNENVGDLAETFAVATGDFAMVCECSTLGCLEQVVVPPEIYRSVRANPSHFILKPGHETQDVEFVIEVGPNFVIVEKREGEPKRVAEQTDPRTA